MHESSMDITASIFDGHWFRKATPEYLQELLQDKQKLQCFQPNFNFQHLLTILEKEINRVREKLFHISRINGQSKSIDKSLPSPKGEYITVQEKVYMPVEENPNYNFIGRILGPRGLTAKQLEQELQCKLMIRGKGSLRNKEKNLHTSINTSHGLVEPPLFEAFLFKSTTLQPYLDSDDLEEELRGKPNWEHLNDKLHINITVEDYENRAVIKVKLALEAIQKFIEQGIKVPDGEDDIKKSQLMELAIINGTYRDTSKISQLSNSKTKKKMNSSASDNKCSTNFPHSVGAVLPNYVSLNNILPKSNHDSSLFNILPSFPTSTSFSQSYNSMLPLFDPSMMNILNSYSSSTFDSMLPFTPVSGLYNLTDVNIGANNFLGPLPIRNMSRMMRPHPYKIMGNI